MRRVAILLLVVLPLFPACSLFSPEFRNLDPTDPVVASLLESAGDDVEAIKHALSEYLDAPVLDYGRVGDELVVKLQPIAQQAGEAAASAFIGKTVGDSSPSGLVAALVAAIAAAVGVAGGRLTKKVKKDENVGSTGTATA